MLDSEIVSYDTKPTAHQFGNFQQIFDYFNKELFGEKLPHVILNFSRKGKNVAGFFAPERWLRSGEMNTHEISLNPEHWNKDVTNGFQTIVHEMVHLWQHVHGKKPRPGYHDKQWGTKMKEVGLYPSNTGAEGGKEIGQKMGDYVIEGGRFQIALDDMPKEYHLPFIAIIPDAKAKAKVKNKYVCPSCQANIWGKSGLNVKCEDCDTEFKPEN